MTNNAGLTVLTNVSATALTSLTNCPGTSATFSTVASGTGPFGYVWKKDGVLLAGATGSSFTTNNVSAASAGTYAVEVTGGCGSATNTANLTVSVPSATPLISQTNCPGTSATFSTTAGGIGPFSYVWKKDGVLLAGATGSSFTTNNVNAASTGTYTVEVTGACGSVTNSATLALSTVVNATAPASQTTCPGSSATFSTAASGGGPFSYVWKKDGVVLAGATGSSFTTNNVSAASAGIYTVEVHSACGNVTNSATLVITEDTTPPVIGCASNKTVECGSAWSFDVPVALDAQCGTNVTLSILSTITNGDGCSEVITRSWQATDCCGNSASCSQIVTVVDRTPPLPGPATTNILALGGTNDDFTGTEPSFPSPGLRLRMANQGSTLKGYDEASVNTTLASTFTNLPDCIVGARLRIRLKPVGDNPGNDFVDVSFTESNGLKAGPDWSRFIGTSANNSEPGLLPGDWTLSSPATKFNLDLSALPLAGGGTTNLLPYLNHRRFVDFICADDSAVDYAILELTISCSAPDKNVPFGSTWTFDVHRHPWTPAAGPT